MKRSLCLKMIIPALLVYFSMSCVTTNKVHVDESNKVFIASGSFDSRFHSDGIMNFILFDDGTLEGEWVTDNKTVTIKAIGNYVVKNGEILMTASGISLLRSSIRSRVIIIASGKINDTESLGQFMIAIDEPSFPNDIGT